MHRRNFVQIILAASASGAGINTSVDRAFARLYEFDFNGVREMTATNLSDPLAHGVRAAAILFNEFQQLNIWEGEDFFETGKRSKAKPNGDARAAFYEELKEARRLADVRSLTDENDRVVILLDTFPRLQVR